MKVLYPKPSNQIADYVEDILVMEDCKVTTPFTLPLFANGKPTLLFQTAKGQIKNNSNYLTLFGQTIFPDTLTIKENFTLIAYFFKPFSLTALFGFSAQELTDSPINFTLLSSFKAEILQEQLLNSTSTEQMLKLLDGYIFSLIRKVQTDISMIKFATEQISNSPQKDILVNVQEDLCITERTFQRLFERTIGISPNQYRRVAQFNAAFQQLNRRQFKQFTDLAFENNYADQSHFIRAFKEFTNLTPKEYLKFGTQE
jgi:AraC-like DNA-binding protein